MASSTEHEASSAFVFARGTATDHTRSAPTARTTTEHPGTATEHPGQHQVATGKFFAKQRQLQWVRVAEELWEYGHIVIGLDGASGGFQGLVDDGDVVYAVVTGSLQVIDYFHGR